MLHGFNKAVEYHCHAHGGYEKTDDTGGGVDAVWTDPVMKAEAIITPRRRTKEPYEINNSKIAINPMSNKPIAMALTRGHDGR